MQITQENAAQYMGRKLVGSGMHYWPLRVTQHDDGSYWLTDRHGVSFRAPDEHDPGVNQVGFDHAED